jgi:hypothetical protein
MSWGVICTTPLMTVSAVGTAPERIPFPSPGSPIPKPGVATRSTRLRSPNVFVSAEAEALSTDGKRSKIEDDEEDECEEREDVRVTVFDAGGGTARAVARAASAGEFVSCFPPSLWNALW